MNIRISQSRDTAARCRSVNRYLNYLFGLHSRILVVRLDLSFGVDSKYRSDLDLCRSALDRLLRNKAHNSMFDHLVGYMWRLELGELNGWHYHCMFFFDGAKRRMDIPLANRIGAYWRDLITDGEGTYWNCNRKKSDYERFDRLGIGMVHHADQPMRDSLELAAKYLCKMDRNLLRAYPDGLPSRRWFGRGEISTARSNKPRLGRPRTF